MLFAYIPCDEALEKVGNYLLDNFHRSGIVYIFLSRSQKYHLTSAILESHYFQKIGNIIEVGLLQYQFQTTKDSHHISDFYCMK